MTESVETVHPCTGTECDHWSHWYGIERTDDTTMTDRTLYSINIEALSPIERELLEDWLELGRAVKVEPIGTIRLHKGRNSMSVDLPPTTSNGTYAIVRVLPEADDDKK